MPRKHHRLKCETDYYQAIEMGIKRFEWRRNDRDFKIFDVVIFEEVVMGVLTGRDIGPFEIAYIIYGGRFGIPPEYCIFQFN